MIKEARAKQIVSIIHHSSKLRGLERDFCARSGLFFYQAVDLRDMAHIQSEVMKKCKPSRPDIPVRTPTSGQPTCMEDLQTR